MGSRKVAISIILAITCFCFACSEQESVRLESEDTKADQYQPQPNSEESFVAVHKNSAGAKEILNPDMRGLMAMAISFLPAEFKFKNVISATREIVAGVKFEILVNVLANDTDPQVCHLEVLEKPWIVTDLGGKLRVLQFSNCTENGEPLVNQSNTGPENNPAVNPIFERKPEELEVRLPELDSQVMPAQEQTETVLEQNAVNLHNSQNQLRQQIQKSLQELFNSNPNIQQAIDEITRSESPQEVQQRYEAVLEQLVQSVVKNIFNQSSSSNESFSYEFPIRLDQPTGSVHDAVVYVEKESDTTSVAEQKGEELVRQTRAVFIGHDERAKEEIKRLIQNNVFQNLSVVNEKDQIVGGHSPVTDADTLNEVKSYSRQALSKVQLGDDKCDLQTVDGVTQQVVAGINYRATVSYKCGANEVDKCELEIWTQSWTNLLKFYWKCAQFEKFSSDRKKRSLLGGHKELDVETLGEWKEIAIKALKKASDEDEEREYKFVEITSATSQVTAGVTYHIEMKAKDENNEEVHCAVKIHSQPWKREKENAVFVSCNEKSYKFKQGALTTSDEHHSVVHVYGSMPEEQILKLFQKFQNHHRRRYSSFNEHRRRYDIFKENLNKIDELNRNEEGTAKYGVTQFADLTTQEFRKYTGLVPRAKHENEVSNPLAEILDFDLPKSFDWREKNVVSDVKNQGNCGSCWTFSVTGNIEGQHAIKYGSLENYSEQELVDCDTTDNGCGGGYMDDAYKAIEKLGGLELENEYPYTARGGKCQFNESKVHVRVKGAVDLPKNETAIAQFLVQNGPISIGLNANAMQFYRGGVSKPFKVLCSAKNLDHGVLLVGYGVDEYPKFKKVLPYWVIKNSWGRSWGEQGYYRLYRGDNRCGVAEMASSAVIE